MNSTRPNSPHFYAKIIVSCVDRDHAVDKVLGYMLEFAHDGVFSTRKGRRSLMLSRLRMARSQYKKAVDRLIQLRLLKKLRNEAGGRYVCYEFTDLLKAYIKATKSIKIDV